MEIAFQMFRESGWTTDPSVGDKSITLKMSRLGILSVIACGC
jgi:hypothetical protein